MNILGHFNSLWVKICIYIQLEKSLCTYLLTFIFCLKMKLSNEIWRNTLLIIYFYKDEFPTLSPHVFFAFVLQTKPDQKSLNFSHLIPSLNWLTLMINSITALYKDCIIRYTVQFPDDISCASYEGHWLWLVIFRPKFVYGLNKDCWVDDSSQLKLYLTSYNVHTMYIMYKYIGFVLV